MDKYKFGNKICELREAKGMTQKELADILDVSDKAVSKWENGQAIPRMETLEKISSTLDITVEELITLSRDNIKRIKITNSFGTLLHIQIDDEIISLLTDESKYMLIDSTVDEHSVIVFGEISFDELVENASEEPDNPKEKTSKKRIHRLSKRADKMLNRGFIRCKCFYTLSDVESDETIVVENGCFSAGKGFLLTKELWFIYPKLCCNCNNVLTNAECLNEDAVFAEFRKLALTSELGINIPLMLIAYPFRRAYFKKVLKPAGLMKFLSNADEYIEKNEIVLEKESQVKHPVIQKFGILILVLIILFGIHTITDVIFVSSNKPYLISADYSKITYSRETYVRIDELPKDAIESNRLLGAIVWDDARIEGKSKWDQNFEENKVCEFTDRDGNKYLWLILNYEDTAFDEDTEEHLEYEDFTEHYVYKLQE